MTALLTQCPYCQTTFRVSTAQMNAAHGLVRCGSCLGVFSASTNEIRIRTPDGYLVEEIDATDNMQQSSESETADTRAATAELHDEDEPADDEPDNEVHGAASNEPSPWHDDPVITLGDMRLHELEDESGDTEAANGTDEYADEQQREEEYPDETPEEYEEERAQEHEEEHEEEHEQQHAEEYADNVDDDTQDDDQLDEYSEPEPAPVAPSRVHASTVEAITAAPEKYNLHHRLSALADDEFDPVNNDQLDTLDSLPVTITHGSYLRNQLVHSALVLLCLLLLFALPLPWLYAKRDTLATHPRFAFMAPFTCKLFSCTPSASLDLGSIYSQQLLVRSHPRYQDALEVSFIFHNDATLPRPFPLVELAFSDLSNNLLANRLFKPEEYLPAELRQLSEMPAQSTVQVTLELQDPGKEAVNYTVKLHPPIP